MAFPAYSCYCYCRCHLLAKQHLDVLSRDICLPVEEGIILPALWPQYDSRINNGFVTNKKNKKERGMRQGINTNI